MKPPRVGTQIMIDPLGKHKSLCAGRSFERARYNGKWQLVGVQWRFDNGSASISKWIYEFKSPMEAR